MKMSHEKENRNGCREQTKSAGEGISADIESLMAYVCDELCWFREEMREDDFIDRICRHCALQECLQKYTDRIQKKYKKIVLCKDCVYRAHGKDGLDWCRLARGLNGDLEEDEGCSRGKEQQRKGE